MFLVHPYLAVEELRCTVRIEAGLADGDINIGLGGLGHIREEGIGSILLRCVSGSVNARRPATIGCEGSVVHSVDGIWAGGLIARHQLAGGAIQHLCGAGQDDCANLVNHCGVRRIDRERSDVAPLHR